MKKTKVYFASPLFSAMEQEFNASVVKQLREANENLDIYLPQENAEINDKSLFADSLMIAKGDNDQLLSSDINIAVLDGATIDVGVATEIGIAYANGIKTIGLYTDVRHGIAADQRKLDALSSEVAENQFHYLNLFTVGCIKDNGKIVTSVESLIEEMKKY